MTQPVIPARPRPPTEPPEVGHEWERLVLHAQRGSAEARHRLLRGLLPSILRVARRTCGRRLHLGSDDEASEALIAFNEAIDRYRPLRGGSFLRFASLVVRHRVIDLLRRSVARREIPVALFVEPLGERDDVHVRSAEYREAMAAYQTAFTEVEGRDELRRYLRLLRNFGITVEQVVRACPRHADARERAIVAARAVVGEPRWRAHLWEKKSLPLKEMGTSRLLGGVSRKTLERHRTYIVGIALLLLCRDETHPV